MENLFRHCRSATLTSTAAAEQFRRRRRGAAVHARDLRAGGQHVAGSTARAKLMGRFTAVKILRWVINPECLYHS
jgi:hypothetical protein